MSHRSPGRSLGLPAPQPLLLLLLLQLPWAAAAAQFYSSKGEQNEPSRIGGAARYPQRAPAAGQSPCKFAPRGVLGLTSWWGVWRVALQPCHRPARGGI